MKRSLQVQGVKWLLPLKPSVGPGRVLGQGSNTLGFYLRKFTQDFCVEGRLHLAQILAQKINGRIHTRNDEP